MLNFSTEQYCGMVTEIRDRTMSAEAISDYNNVLFIESTTLQIRKILELISYLSLLVNKNKLNSKQRCNWHAKQIIEDLSEKTTIFYPFPSHIFPPESQNTQPLLVPINNKVALSQKEFKDLYQFCGTVLHAQHPLKNQLDFRDIRDRNKSSIEKLKNLLASHVIGIRHESNMYTFLHVEIDFTNSDETKPSSIKQYNSKIYSEIELVKIFNGHY